MKLFTNQLGEQGTAIVILHGLYGSGDNWLSIAKVLAANHRVFLVDQRNHGKSDWADEMDYAMMADDLAETMKHLGIDKAHILGHSMGAKTAMTFSLKHPDRISSLLAVDMGIKEYNTSSHHALLQIMKGLEPGRFGRRKEIEEELAPLIPEDSIRLFLMKNIIRDDEKKFSWKINLSALANGLGQIGAALDCIETHFEGPALFIAGEQSDYVEQQDLGSIRVVFPKSQFVFIENAGHWVHADQPAQLIETLSRFVQSID